MIGCTSGFVRLHIGIAGSLWWPKGTLRVRYPILRNARSDVGNRDVPGPYSQNHAIMCSIFYLFNVTGLLPGTTYELTVVAVSQGGNVVARSQSSNSLQITTTVTGNSTLCVHRCHVTCGHTTLLII